MHRRFLPATLAVLGLASTLIACTDEPKHPEREPDYKPIEIAVLDRSNEQLILGELYQHAFKKKERNAFLIRLSSDKEVRKVERIRNRSADLVVGCTGEILYEVNPKLAEEISAEYRKALESGKIDSNNGEWRDKVYKAMVGSLPGKLAASDPSNALGCENYEGPELPQNIVPIFRNEVLNRNDKLVLNYISGTISTNDMAKLAEEVEKEKSVSAVVDRYINQKGF
ncbi:hypothetical protein [Corynebacterium freiburgense]|uniref:hypothetical protein n=1 Tax=Corynebacterium freiburgense TaxID=556548 RepID=UPI0004238B4C|nr:hypothetical protein [Corynebacterium freiburgense]WJZ02301.1 hypothetical protein CFREI_05025 [Corynebacterium freiburgense]